MRFSNEYNLIIPNNRPKAKWEPLESVYNVVLHAESLTMGQSHEIEHNVDENNSNSCNEH